jgi:hypothetical protein
MQQRLSLSWPAIERVGWTILSKLGYMTPHRPPSFNLPLIVGAPATHEVTAIPLKPPARILVINPAVLSPD